MRIFESLHRRKTLFLVFLIVIFSAFTADVLDLREELRFISCPSGSLDNNVTTGITSTGDFAPESVVPLFSVDQKSSVTVSFLYRLPYALRAPPARS
ncbi:MAG: hypothetical protein LLG97_14865 [Deltaproteobacteria bacterium]|nr:hypothetical protein [Deltaproteobacteria bacterium]